jgi:hypothetical protein
MTSALSSMDLREQLTTLLLGNIPHENVVGATAVEIPFYYRVAFSQLHYALCRHMVFRKEIFLQTVLNLGDPCIGTTPSIRTWCSRMLAMIGAVMSGSTPAPAIFSGQSDASKETVALLHH